MTAITAMLKQRCARCGHPRGAHCGEFAKECLHRNDINTDRCTCSWFAISEETWIASGVLPDPEETVTVMVREHFPAYDGPNDFNAWTGSVGGLTINSHGFTAVQARDAALTRKATWRLVEKPADKPRPSRAEMRAALMAALNVLDQSKTSTADSVGGAMQRYDRALELVRAALGKESG
jgi:hypothetical protein